MTRPVLPAGLIRVTGILCLSVVLLTLPPTLVITGAVPILPDRIQAPLGYRSGTLCASECTCTFCDQLINGRCYTNGHLGPETCTSTCGTKNCQFQPNEGNCGPILYLGCDHSPCSGAPPAPPRPTSPPPPIPPGMGPTPTPAWKPTAVPTTNPLPACNLTWVKVQPPVIGEVIHDPPFPVLQAQEFGSGQDHGVTFHLPVQGGRAIQYAQRAVKECRTTGSYPADCPNDWTTVCETYVQAEHPDPVIQVSLDLVLKGQSQSWIHSSLASRYTRAHARQALHSPDQWTGSTMAAALVFPDWYPQDPGIYDGTVTARTGGTPLSAPQTVARGHEVIVHLRDTTLAP